MAGTAGPHSDFGGNFGYKQSQVTQGHRFSEQGTKAGLFLVNGGENLSISGFWECSHALLGQQLLISRKIKISVCSELAVAGLCSLFDLGVAA